MAATARRLGVPVLALAVLGAAAALVRGGGTVESTAGEPAAAGAPTFNVLVFSKATGWRHKSIEPGVEAVRRLGAEHGFAVDATEDAAVFTAERLAAYRVVVFLNTSEEVLDSAQEAALQAFVRGGGGFVGVHSAADTEYDWPWYGRLVGAYFHSHPEVQEARLRVVDRDHPATRHLPAEWMRADEWYNFKALPEGVRVLIELDESSYEGGIHGDSHPVAWAHEFDGGRAFYTALGHPVEGFAEPLYLRHLLGAILYAAEAEPDQA